MAFVTAGRVSRVAVELLSRSLVLPMTATRVPDTEFGGDNGDTVSVRVRLPRTANTQANPGAGPITYTAISEVKVDVSLTHLYDATKLPDESLSLEIADFATQVTEPQAKSVAVGAEDQIADLFNTALGTPDIGLASENGAGMEAAILEARRILGRNNVPAGDRWLAVNPEGAEYLLSQDKFTRVDASGSSSALRDAIIGRLYGFTIVETSAIDAIGGSNGDAAAVAYHTSGVVWANRAPVNPRGANDSASASEGGVALRQVFDFDPDILSDRSVLSTFAGASLVYEDGASASDIDRLVTIAST